MKAKPMLPERSRTSYEKPGGQIEGKSGHLKVLVALGPDPTELLFLYGTRMRASATSRETATSERNRRNATHI